MGLFKNEKSSWLGIVVNPIGYIIDRKPLSEMADRYAGGNPPANGINLATATEESFKIDRQQWIDSCAIALKSEDAGVSKANAAQACAGRFDREPINAQVEDALAQRAQAQTETVKLKIEENSKKAIVIIIIFLLVAAALYILTRKS